ncbi:low molecular weight phosphatase family protein [Agromyces tropicus]|uniref:Low molecular weight phosphatase family protein n=1 Tax=Agromyces tropicus TaxID=555371 RepID=A0ABN2UAZ3_9MICO
MDPETFRVLVVCTGNLNRSALGAALLRTWADWYLPGELAGRVVVSSAGLAAPAGRPMRRRTQAIAERLGADGHGHRARQVDEAQVRSADLVLAADVAHRDGVLGLVPSMLRSSYTIREAGAIATALGVAAVPQSVAELRARIALLSDRRSLGTAGDGDITDPQGKDDEAFRAMAREEVPPLAALAALLFGMPRGEVEAVGAIVADPDAFPFEGLGPSSERGSGGSAERPRRRWFGRRDS